MPASLRAHARGLLLGLLFVPGAALGAQDTLRTPLSTNGLPGVIITPVAGSVPVGLFALGVNNFPDFEALWARPSLTLGQQHNGYISFNLFSWLSLSTRVSDVIPREPRKMITVGGPGGVLTIPAHNIDLSPDIQVLLAPERGLFPGLAVGAYDVTGTGALKARYAVASKTLGSVALISAGYGFGPILLNGAFGSVELHPTGWSSVEGEWDGKRLNAGIALRPALPGALAQYISAPRITALWADGKGWYVGTSLELPWSGAPARSVGPRPSHSVPPEVQPSWSTSLELREALEARGFENLAVATSDSLVRVRYEDRVHLRNALDGLASVLRLVASQTAEPARRAEITILSSDQPVLRVTATAVWLTALRDGDEAGLASGGLRFAYPSENDPGEGPWQTAPGGQSSRGHADLVLRPVLNTHLAWEDGLADARVGLVPTLEVPLLAGLYATVGYGIPLAQTKGMVVTVGPLPKPSLDVAQLGYIWNRPLSPESDVAVNWSGGRFDGNWEGVRQQVAVFLGNGILRLDADAAATRPVGGSGVSTMGVVGARVLIPGIDTRVWVTTGRYLYGDLGVTAGVSRYFGDTQVALGVESTQNGSQATFTVSLPLVGKHSLRPALVRPRLPAEWSNSESVSLSSFSGTGNIAFDVAQQLQSGSDQWDLLFDRDRLNPAAVQAAIGGARFNWWQ